jgi:hypothetical protein
LKLLPYPGGFGRGFNVCIGHYQYIKEHNYAGLSTYIARGVETLGRPVTSTVEEILNIDNLVPETDT